MKCGKTDNKKRKKRSEEIKAEKISYRNYEEEEKGVTKRKWRANKERKKRKMLEDVIKKERKK